MKIKISQTGRRILTLTILNVLMIGYVGFMFYESEPKYINNVYRLPKIYDYVVVSGMGYNKDATMEGLVVQTDSIGFVMRFRAGMMNRDFSSGLYPYSFSSPQYRIVGRGTFYHKVNAYVGFNIMFITTCIIIVFFLVVFYTEMNIVWQLLNKGSYEN